MGIIGTKPNQVPTNGDLGDLAYKDEKNLNPDVLAKILNDRFFHSGNIDTVNAGSATKLQTPRTLTIGNTGKSFDGSADVSWSLAEIGAVGYAILPSGIDLNTVVSPGFFRLSDSSVNGPPSVSFGQLIVARGGGDTILQIVTGYNNGEIYWRQGNPPEIGSSGSWRPWHKFFHSGNLGAASETAAGIVELATAAEAQALVDTTRAITPSTLAQALKGANQSLAGTGYQKLPGGLIIQWGITNLGSNLVGVGGASVIGEVVFPITFPTGPFSASVAGFVPNSINGEATENFLSIQGLSATTLTVAATRVAGSSPEPEILSVAWIAIGY